MTTTRLALAALATMTLCACPPDRDGGGDGTGGVPWGNTLETAFYTQVEYEEGSGIPYSMAYVSLIDEEGWSCADLGWTGSVPWWQIGDETVQWVEAQVIHGVEVDDWEQDYPSQVKWFDDGGSWDVDSTFFTGQIGLGGDDGPDNEPVPVGRGTTAWLGEDPGAVLSLVRLEDDTVRGAITSEAGDFEFEAIHCGIVYDSVDGEVPPGDGGDETEPDDEP